MVVRKLPGEPYDAYQGRVWEADRLLERLEIQCKVLQPLLDITNRTYTDQAWMEEARKLNLLVAREVVNTCRELAAFWGLVPPKKAEEDPDDLPF